MKRILPVSFLAIAACAYALELPQMKPGMWENTIRQSIDGKDGKANVTQGCRDAASLAHAKEVGDAYAKKSCSKYDVRKEGGKWIIDMVCKTGGMTMTSHNESTLGENSYHTEMSATYDPPPPGRARTVTISEGKWLGPC